MQSNKNDTKTSIKKFSITKKSERENTFFCFSPPVMIVTFAIEIGLALYVLWRYKLTPVTRLALLLLVFLAIFQLAEYMVCQNIGDSQAWARAGYAAITLLPALGLHLVYQIARAKRKRLVWLAYAAATAFALYFLLAADAIGGQVCTGNYAIFELTRTTSWLYTGYYYGLLGLGIAAAVKFSEQATKRIRQALWGVVIGYGVFIVPTAAVNLVEPATRAGVPSIMCGFAVFFAFILVGWVLPRAQKRVKRS